MSLFTTLKSALKALVAPAEDPRGAYATPGQRYQETLARVRQAQVKVRDARRLLEFKVTEARAKSEELAAQGPQNPFTIQLRQVVGDELRTFDEELVQLRQGERELDLLERHLSTQVRALSARQDALSARYSAAEARLAVTQELEGIPGELMGLTTTVDRAERRTEDARTKASALDHIIGLGMVPCGVSLKDPEAQQLAGWYASQATVEESAILKAQLDQGFKSLLDLDREYVQLQAVLERRSSTDPLSVSYVPPLAEDAYRQGLSVLRDSLDLMQALRSPSREQIGQEMAELERQVAALQKEGTDLAQTKIKLRQERIVLHKEHLEIVQRQQIRVDELLHQTALCVASLNRTRIELAAMKVEGSETSVGAITATLRKAIDDAREVQEEVKRLGL